MLSDSKSWCRIKPQCVGEVKQLFKLTFPQHLAHRPGYDCPETATYMPINLMGPFGQQYSYNESVCFFEMTDQATSWR